jgi:hypothetical protein
MTSLLSPEQQIVQVHAELIRRVVMACHNRDLRPALEPVLRASEDNGWTALVRTIRRILDGARDLALLLGLDDEDRVIIESILRGLRDPASLPGPAPAAEPSMAAPGLAHMIHAAATGNVQALQLVANMAEQMSHAGGEMAQLAAIVRPLINGERDPEQLCRDLSAQGETLVHAILAELNQLNMH